MSPSRRVFLLSSLGFPAACSRRRRPGFDGYAFIANEEGRAIAVVDLNTFTLARHIRLDAGPVETMPAPGRPAVYVLTPATGTVHEVDARQMQLSRRVHPGRAAVSMRLGQEAGSFWVLCREPSQLVRVRTDTFKPELRIALPDNPTGFDLSADGNSAAITFGQSGSFALADLSAGRMSRMVETGGQLSGARFRSDSKQLLVGNLDGRALSVYRVPDCRPIVQLPLAVRPENLCFNSDRGQLFITGDGLDAVAVIYPYRTEVAETVLAGRAPRAMAALTTREYNFLFVANPTSGDVTIMDIETRRAIAAVHVGEDPGFITATPDGQYVLVLNRRSGDMGVIRVAAITAKRTRSAPLFTLIPVGSKPVSAAVAAV